MTKHDFNHAFAPMCKALNVPVNDTQAGYFWEKFQHHDAGDFAATCSHMAMGNPGWLPKPVPFWEEIIRIRDERLEGVKGQREQETGQFWKGQNLPDEEFAKGKAALTKLKAMLAKGPMKI